MEKIKVFVRTRNFENNENLDDSKFKINLNNNSIDYKHTKNNTKNYKFDKCFPVKIQNNEIYNKNLKLVIDSILNGIDNTIFVYGQTGSGKTYTIKGDENKKGIFQLSLIDLFKSIDLKKKLNKNVKYIITMSYLEIYNEQVYDLLSDYDEINKPLQIFENIENNRFEIKDGKKIEIENFEEGLKFFKIGEENRHYACTKLNHNSSRSHTILSLTIKSLLNKNINNNKNSDNNCIIIKQGVLNFVDLAGSEKLNSYENKEYFEKEINTNNQNNRNISPANSYSKIFKESKYINKSLFFLTQVIYLKSKNYKKKKNECFIPYRNSPLTKLLKNSLGGNSRTILILCILANFPKKIENFNLNGNFSNDLIDKYIEYTLSTMRFGQNAKTIENNIKENIVGKINSNILKELINNYETKIKYKDSEIDKLKNNLLIKNKEISKLKKLLNQDNFNNNSNYNYQLKEYISYNSGIIFLNKNEKIDLYKKINNFDIKFEEYIYKINSLDSPNLIKFFELNDNNGFKKFEEFSNKIFDDWNNKNNEIIRDINNKIQLNNDLLKNTIISKNNEIIKLNKKLSLYKENSNISLFSKEYLNNKYYKLKNICKNIKNEIIMRDIINKIKLNNKDNTEEDKKNDKINLNKNKKDIIIELNNKFNLEFKKLNELNIFGNFEINLKNYYDELKNKIIDKFDKINNLSNIQIKNKKLIQNLYDNYKKNYVDFCLLFNRYKYNLNNFLSKNNYTTEDDILNYKSLTNANKLKNNEHININFVNINKENKFLLKNEKSNNINENNSKIWKMKNKNKWIN